MSQQININKIPPIDPSSLTFTTLNNVLENGKILHTKTGRRFVVFKHEQESFANPKDLGKIDFNALSLIVAQKVSNYPLDKYGELDVCYIDLCWP